MAPAVGVRAERINWDWYKRFQGVLQQKMEWIQRLCLEESRKKFFIISNTIWWTRRMAASSRSGKLTQTMVDRWAIAGRPESWYSTANHLYRSEARPDWIRIIATRKLTKKVRLSAMLHMKANRHKWLQRRVGHPYWPSRVQLSRTGPRCWWSAARRRTRSTAVSNRSQSSVVHAAAVAITRRQTNPQRRMTCDRATQTAHSLNPPSRTYPCSTTSLPKSAPLQPTQTRQNQAPQTLIRPSLPSRTQQNLRQGHPPKRSNFWAVGRLAGKSMTRRLRKVARRRGARVATRIAMPLSKSLI